MNIYVASSWRNPVQQTIVHTLRSVGHSVYDFRNPPDRTGFAWSEIDPEWKSWDARQLRDALRHPAAQAGFAADMGALEACDACVLVLPCGLSAHLELGWASGAGKKTVVLALPQFEPYEPELMYLMVEVERRLDHFCLSIHEMLDALRDTNNNFAKGPQP